MNAATSPDCPTCKRYGAHRAGCPVGEGSCYCSLLSHNSACHNCAAFIALLIEDLWATAPDDDDEDAQ